jgi:flagellar motor switch protein FliN/FliY
VPDEAEGGNKSDDDLEAEMLRMMEQEASGAAPADATPADAAPAAQSDNPEDEMMQMMQQAMSEAQAETAASGTEPNADRMLEMEMLKAMQGDEASSVAPSFPAFSAPTDTEGGAGLSRILDVGVKITVELGSNQTPIKDILLWGEGTLVELERMDREPVDVLVNNKLFARGEVVVVGETFGVKITELLNGPTRK